MTSINFHRVSSVTADTSNGFWWLRIESRNGDYIAIHMEQREAEAMADAWNNETAEPEPLTYDEALGMKCDAEARMDEARKLKGMTR